MAGKLRCIGVLGLLALGGCLNPNVALNDYSRQLIRNDTRPIQVALFTTAGNSGLQLTTYENARLAGGSARQALALREGRELANDLNLPHPMATTRDLFVRDLKAKAGLYRFKVLPETLDTKLDEPLKLRDELGHDRLLDFRGTYHLVFLSSDHTRYRLIYDGTARLMDLNTGVIFWQAKCHTEIADPTGPTLADLRERRGAKLQGWLQRGAGECSRQLIQHFLGKKA
jgi:hypothetical protein